MRISKTVALVAVAAAFGLSACGGSDSAFKAKMMEACEKDGGEMPGVGKVDCACAVAIMDAEVPSDVKEFFVKLAEAQENPEKMKDINPAEMMPKMEKMQESAEKAEARIKAECKKS